MKPRSLLLTSSAVGVWTLFSLIWGEGKGRGDTSLSTDWQSQPLSRRSGLHSCVGRTGLLKDMAIPLQVSPQHSILLCRFPKQRQVPTGANRGTMGQNAELQASPRRGVTALASTGDELWELASLFAFPFLSSECMLGFPIIWVSQLSSLVQTNPTLSHLC